MTQCESELFEKFLMILFFRFRLNLEPINLTAREDWVWLRLCDLSLFDRNAQKGKKRWIAEFGTDLRIERTESNEMTHVMEMIKELAVYENMLEQCQMTVEHLQEDYKNPPLAVKSNVSQGKSYVSSVAWLGDKPIGYTVAIGIYSFL